jgi:hypothetical protein
MSSSVICYISLSFQAPANFLCRLDSNSVQKIIPKTLLRNIIFIVLTMHTPLRSTFFSSKSNLPYRNCKHLRQMKIGKNLDITVLSLESSMTASIVLMFTPELIIRSKPD